MGTVGKCPHCKNNITLGTGFSGLPGYSDANGKPFDPEAREECPECGGKVKKNEWLAPDQFLLWD